MATKVLQLRKAIYGLKQSGQRWYQTLRGILGKIDFTRSEHNHRVFLRQQKGTLNGILLSHVDDFTIAALKAPLIKEIKDGLQKHIDIHNLGEIHWMLGLEIKRNRELRTISLSQRSYIDPIITKYGFKDAKPLSIPIVANLS